MCPQRLRHREGDGCLSNAAPQCPKKAEVVAAAQAGTVFFIGRLVGVLFTGFLVGFLCGFAVGFFVGFFVEGSVGFLVEVDALS